MKLNFCKCLINPFPSREPESIFPTAQPKNFVSSFGSDKILQKIKGDIYKAKLLQKNGLILLSPT
ncbi:MAG TPA: hypothetical protein DCY88_29000 [Cyanobacteria bacterium UBA11372]|nr:hypothetical protein [Cyanobacteria bacterium UBA11372]